MPSLRSFASRLANCGRDVGSLARSASTMIGAYVFAALRRHIVATVICSIMAIVAVVAIKGCGPDAVTPPPKSKAVIAITGTENAARRGDIVFVHGLDGDAHGTWTNRDAEDFFWPKWLGDELSDVGVWCVDYDAHASEWLGGSMPIEDRSTNLLEELRLNGIGKKPVIFVGHSLGGIVIKQMLHDAATMNKEGWDMIAKRTKGVVFIATPHSGSLLASLQKMLAAYVPGTRPSDVSGQLQRNASQLRALSNWYSSNVERLRIRTISFFETREINGFLVVDEASANPGLSGVIPIPLDADHISICKPRDAEQQVCRSVLDFVKSHLRAIGEPSEMSLSQFVEGFTAARGDANDLEVFKRAMSPNQFTWDAYVVTIVASEKNPGYFVGPAPDTPARDQVLASCWPDDFNATIRKGTKVRITGRLNMKATTSTGAALEECEIQAVLAPPP